MHISLVAVVTQRLMIRIKRPASKGSWEEEGLIKMASGKESELNTPNDATDGWELPEELALSSTLSQSLRGLHHHPDSFWDSSPASPETKPEAEPELAVEKEVREP